MIENDPTRNENSDMGKRLFHVGRVLQILGILFVLEAVASTIFGSVAPASWLGKGEEGFSIYFIFGEGQYWYLKSGGGLLWGIMWIVGGWGIRNNRRWGRLIVLVLSYATLIGIITWFFWSGVSLAFGPHDVTSDITFVLAFIWGGSSIAVGLAAWALVRFIGKPEVRRCFATDSGSRADYKSSDELEPSGSQGRESGKTRYPRIRVVVISVLVVLIILGLGFVFWQMHETRNSRQRAFKFLATLGPQKIERIVIYNEEGTEKLKQINSTEAIESFATACEKMEAYYPNHPPFDRSWELRFYPLRRIIVEFYYISHEPDEVFGAILVKEDGDAYYVTWFRSRTLRDWFDKHGLGQGEKANARNGGSH